MRWNRILIICSHSTTDNCGPTEGAGVVCVNMTTNNTLTCPIYPYAYPDDVHKCWVQAPSHGEAVSLIFTAFDVKNLVDLLFFISIQYFNSCTTVILALVPAGSQSTRVSMEDLSSGVNSQALILLQLLPPSLKMSWLLCASMQKVTKAMTTKGSKQYLLTPHQSYLQ